MKQLTLILASLVFIFSTQAQCWNSPEPDNRLSFAMGAGYSTHANTGVANLQVEYNISKLRIAYSQSVLTSSSAPVFFEVKSGYQLGNSVSITPHIGWAYGLMDVNQGIHSTYLTYGAEFNIEVSPYNHANPRLYLDYNSVGLYHLFVFGMKASF